MHAFNLVDKGYVVVYQENGILFHIILIQWMYSTDYIGSDSVESRVKRSIRFD